MSPAEISLQGCYVLQVADKEVRSGGPHWRYRGNNQLGGNEGQNEWTAFSTWPYNCLVIPHKNQQVSSEKVSMAVCPVSKAERIFFFLNQRQVTHIFSQLQANIPTLYTQMNKNATLETERANKWKRGIKKSLVHLSIIFMGLLPKKRAIIGPLYQCHTDSQWAGVPGSTRNHPYLWSHKTSSGHFKRWGERLESNFECEFKCYIYSNMQGKTFKSKTKTLKIIFVSNIILQLMLQLHFEAQTVKTTLTYNHIVKFLWWTF